MIPSPSLLRLYPLILYPSEEEEIISVVGRERASGLLLKTSPHPPTPPDLACELLRDLNKVSPDLICPVPAGTWKNHTKEMRVG